MLTFLYGFYILIWPAITLVMLALICGATLRDMREAKREHRDIV